MDAAERRGEVAGLEAFWREGGDGRRVLYVHGVPTASWVWNPFLERIGGVAPDLPGFGHSGKPGDFDYSIDGYADWLETFCEAVGLDRFSLVVHDWGAVGLALAQRHPGWIERLILFSTVPFLPGYRWHRVARGWRTPLLGELLMGATTKAGMGRGLRAATTRPEGPPPEFVERIWDGWDHGTQRAILRLYRSAPPEVLERAGRRLGDLRCPALVLWPTRDPYIGPAFGPAYADALGGEATLETVEAGHWSWLDRPELVDRVAGFLG